MSSERFKNVRKRAGEWAGQSGSMGLAQMHAICEEIDSEVEHLEYMIISHNKLVSERIRALESIDGLAAAEQWKPPEDAPVRRARPVEPG